jgi:UDP-N-acetylglucosamine/UDP-N-acetylgalactosamine diphosphorylase
MLKLQALAAQAADSSVKPSSNAAVQHTSQSVAAGTSKPVLWYIMTSSATHQATVDCLEERGHFGMQREQIVLFRQGVLPCLTEDGSPIVGEDGLVRT